MKIGLDFDGVISDCGKLKSEGAKRLYGIEVPPSDFKKEIVVGGGYLTAEQYRELQRIIYETTEYGLLMEPVEGALFHIPQLLSEGHTILVVTSRYGESLELAKEWSVNHGLRLDFIGISYGGNKAVAATGLDFFVDDDFDKLEPLVDVVPYRFLFSWEYNAHVDTGLVAKRVLSWKHLYDEIQALDRSY